MNIPLLALGILIQIIVLVDIFKTIIYINGAGFLSGLASRAIWRLFFWASKGNGNSKLLNLSGPVILLFFLFMWVTLIWLGYSLMYLSDSDSVINTATGASASIIGKIYYVGYTLTSLGNGGYRPASGAWQIISNIMGLNSTVFISLCISYLLPVLQAVIDKRSLALQIAMLGSTPEEIISNGYNGKNFNAIYQRFTNLESLLIKHSERHLAYPILHYFHANNKLHALPLNLAALDEAMIIQKIYKIDNSENSFHWKVLANTLNNFYERLDSVFIIEVNDIPPFDYKDKLEKYSSNIAPQEVQLELQKFEQRRKKVLGYVRKDGWSWNDVIHRQLHRQHDEL